jgi:hypothetical protein
MAVTKDKLASLVVYGVVAVAAIVVFNSWGLPAMGLVLAPAVSLLGLALIWLAEPLGEAGCFSRGVPNPSPPAMIEAFGWLFLVGYPILVTCVLRGASLAS